MDRHSCIRALPPDNSLWHPRLFSGHKTRENEEITEREGHVYDISFVQEGGEGDLWAKPGQSEHEECLDDDTNKWKKDILHIMAREKRLSCLHVGRGQQPLPQF